MHSISAKFPTISLKKSFRWTLKSLCLRFQDRGYSTNPLNVIDCGRVGVAKFF